MGKAIKEAKVKVGGQAGPMGQGQGVPLTQAVGQGGLKGAMDGKPIGPNTQVPGAKGLTERAQATGRIPGMGVPNTGGGYAQSKQNWLQRRQPRGMGVPNTGGGYAQSKQNWLQRPRGLIGNIFGKSGPGMAAPGQAVMNPVGHAGNPGVAKLPPPTSY